MTDNKMLQAISSLISSLRKEMRDGFKKMDEGFKNVNERLDMQGKSLAYLEDDTPTLEDHDKLEIKVL